MRGKPILVVQDLLDYLMVCNPQALISIVPEDGEPYQIKGILDFPDNEPNPETWLLVDDVEEIEQTIIEGLADDWEGERPGDMATQIQSEEPKKDVIKVRGKLRSA